MEQVFNKVGVFRDPALSYYYLCSDNKVSGASSGDCHSAPLTPVSPNAVRKESRIELSKEEEEADLQFAEDLESKRAHGCKSF